ncbi:AAA family ATPase [Ectothiorhodospiraceae bacterium BW-2]|nr:AAA family ATPase [Ectothiorhodospiraceae bacterium BW-2]
MKQMQPIPIKLPYGLSDFNALISEGYYYADRTDLIPAIEEAGRQLLFLRPRRFGKSCLLSMLENYYDLGRAEQFETLFGALTIGQNPTPNRNRYLILNWDFSTIDASGDVMTIARGVHGHINSAIERFSLRYHKQLQQPVRLNGDDALRSLENLINVAAGAGHPLYLLVDEYDNFANEVLTSRAQGKARYDALTTGEGIIKTVFKMVKSLAGGRGLERVFLTGVSPLVMSDITSGYNVVENISHFAEFNRLCGFERDEVVAMNRRIAQLCQLPPGAAMEAMEVMRHYYNGYCFSEASDARLYNPTLCLYFWKQWQHSCEYPKQMLDDNLAMDKNRIAYIASLPHGSEVIEQLTASDRAVTMWLQTGFGIEKLLAREVPDKGYLLSLLYWFGVLTVDGNDALGETCLKIPNQVIRQLYLERLQQELLPSYELANTREAVAKQFYLSGEMAPLAAFIEQNMLQSLANRDLRWANELSPKLIFMTLLHNTFFYNTQSEAATGKQYIDILFEVRPDRRQSPLLDHLFELKFIPLKQLKLSDRELQTMSREELAELPLVKAALEGAKQQGEVYWQQLQHDQPQKAWQLQRHAVVLLGFSRLVWELR